MVGFAVQNNEDDHRHKQDNTIKNRTRTTSQKYQQQQQQTKTTLYLSCPSSSSVDWTGPCFPQEGEAEEEECGGRVRYFDIREPWRDTFVFF